MVFHEERIDAAFSSGKTAAAGHGGVDLIPVSYTHLYQQMQAEASQMAASSQLPEAQEQALDEYPMPCLLYTSRCV